MKKPIRVVKNRPAETATPVAMALAMLIAKISGFEDTDTVVYLAIVISFVPAGVTWLVKLKKESEDDG